MLTGTLRLSIQALNLHKRNLGLNILKRPAQNHITWQKKNHITGHLMNEFMLCLQPSLPHLLPQAQPSHRSLFSHFVEFHSTGV